MNGRHQLYVACIVVITCKIAQGQLNNFLLDNGILQAPDGFHYETLGYILQNRDPSTYTIMTLGNAINRLITPTNNGRNNGNDDDNEDEEDEDSETGDTSRQKRSFSWYTFPFMSNDDKSSVTSTTTTTSTTATSTTKTTDDDVAIAVADPKTISTIDVKHFDGNTDVVANTERVPDSGMVASSEGTSTDEEDSTEKDLNIVNIGEDIEISKTIAAPYIPLVSKVAVSIIPVISQGQLLMLSVNMASITMQAIRNYEQRKSLSKMATDAASTPANHALHKRDSTTVGEHTSNLYDSLKSMFKSRFKLGSYFRNENDSNNDIDITEKSSNEVIQNKILEMSQYGDILNYRNLFSKENKYEDDNSNDDSSNDSNVDDYDMEGSIEIPEINKTMFDMYLQKLMMSQPEFIQVKTGAELVEYLKNRKVEFPQKGINSRTVFEFLMVQFHFDNEVTKEQKEELIDILDKTTSFFIDRALKNKQNKNLL